MYHMVGFDSALHLLLYKNYNVYSILHFITTVEVVTKGIVEVQVTVSEDLPFFSRKKNFLEKNTNTDQNYSDLQLRLDSNSENQYEHMRNVVYENSSMEKSG